MEEANQPPLGKKKGISVPSIVEPSSIACNPLLREHRGGLTDDSYLVNYYG
jgi:hypothetical protein